VTRPYDATVYAGTAAAPVLDAQNVTYETVTRSTVTEGSIDVLKLPVPDKRSFRSFVTFLEKTTRYRVPLYNADIDPEEQFLYRRDLRPFTKMTDDFERIESDAMPDLTVMHITVTPDGIQDETTPVQTINCGTNTYAGEETDILTQFARHFAAVDPDVIAMPHAFRRLPYLNRRLREHDIDVAFHRWDETPITYKGGSSFYSYGNVRYHDFAIRLHGRFLLDTTSTVGDECGVDAIMEISRLTGSRFQQAGSRSFGAAFQKSLVRELIQRDYLVPYKEKPIDEPLSMADRVKADRGGLSLDPLVGFHEDVAEIDFSSMFPWIIHNKNISAETIMSDEPPLEKAPGIPVETSWHERGIVAACVKPILDQRMRYKEDPTPRNLRRAEGLKWILVTCYGYLRFREFKLGLASSHMAICAYAREILLDAKRIAERRGFTVVHGIVDSVYVKKEAITKDEAEALCDEIEHATGIPISCDGTYDWLTFLPSIQDRDVPTPTKHYGIYRSGDVKARGILLRRSSTPELVKQFQRHTIQDFATCDEPRAIVERVPHHCSRIRSLLDGLDERSAAELAVRVKLSTTEYDHDVPQKQVVATLKERGVDLQPGMTVHYVHTTEGARLPDGYEGNPDVEAYKKQLVRALYELVQPYGVEQAVIESLCADERQTRL
jgi:DNA polymerase elongation subunit (family B)